MSKELFAYWEEMESNRYHLDNGMVAGKCCVEGRSRCCGGGNEAAYSRLEIQDQGKSPCKASPFDFNLGVLGSQS